jgi:2-polyprenyl-3-methyl-5-hydroxy-6-metoxy-1,4-benzoquinol methylase
VKDAQELTTVSFWDSHWKDTVHAQHPYSGYAGRVWKQIFDCAFASARPGDTCVEVGCGDSHHLPQIAQQYGLKVSGLDYSEEGCQLAREHLRKVDISAAIYQCDLFEPPVDLCGQFDFVVSFGVVEHFDDPSTALSAMKRLLKPGGRILTTAPNVSPHCLNVSIQRIIGPKILALHKLMTIDQLRQFHERSGFQTIHSGYEGMGFCLASDVATAKNRLLQQTSFRALQVVRRCFELVKLDPSKSSLTGLFMVYIGQA